MDNVIAEIRKNARERVVVALGEFEKDGKTFDMISARVHYDDGCGAYKPGRNGINLQVKLLPALVAALSQAEDKARAAGLIQDDGAELSGPGTKTRDQRGASL